MKSSILIANDRSQIVLEPETEADKLTLQHLASMTTVTICKECPITLRGGGYMMAEPWGQHQSTRSSFAIVLTPAPTTTDS